MIFQNNRNIRSKNIFWLLIFAFVFSIKTQAQKPVVSPRDSVKSIFNGKAVTINYGKPSARGRKIFGSFVPYYRIWRTGAGAATIIRTEADLEVDGALVPRGSYSLYTLPTEERCTLIINKQTGQWGIDYNPQLDLARVNMIVKKLKTPVEELSFKIEKNDNNYGILKIEWENTSFSIPFHVSSEPLIPSPRDSSYITVNEKQISVNYGSPSMRGRKIMGSVVPYGKIWRTGANAATSFTTQADLAIGNLKIPRGSYTLYSIPSSKQWKLIINKQTGQWGTVYNKKLDLARIAMKKKVLADKVERFTITLERKGEKSGVLKLSWEKTQLSVDFKIQ